MISGLLNTLGIAVVDNKGQELKDSEHLTDAIESVCKLVSEDYSYTTKISGPVNTDRQCINGPNTDSQVVYCILGLNFIFLCFYVW